MFWRLYVTKQVNYQVLSQLKNKLDLFNNVRPQSSSRFKKKKEKTKSLICLDRFGCPLIVHTTDYQP